MTAALIADLCGACLDQDCECCDLHVWGGPCGCNCPAPPFRQPQPVIIVINKRYDPVPPRPQQRTHCFRGHPLTGNNVYQEAGDDKRRRCLKCRRASWRKYQYRKHQRKSGAA